MTMHSVLEQPRSGKRPLPSGAEILQQAKAQIDKYTFWRRDPQAILPIHANYVAQRGAEIAQQLQHEYRPRNQLDLERQGVIGERLALALLAGVQVPGKAKLSPLSYGIETVFPAHAYDDYFNQTDIGMALGIESEADGRLKLAFYGIDVVTSEKTDAKVERLLKPGGRLFPAHPDADLLYLPDEVMDADGMVIGLNHLQVGDRNIFRAQQTPLIACVAPKLFIDRAPTATELAKSQELLALQLALQSRLLAGVCAHKIHPNIPRIGERLSIKDLENIFSSATRSTGSRSLPLALKHGSAYCALFNDLQETLEDSPLIGAALNEVSEQPHPKKHSSLWQAIGAQLEEPATTQLLQITLDTAINIADKA